MIKFESVSFKYKDSEQANSLHNINFSINNGEIVLLCGKSGCGKTTITRLINGLIPHYYEGELQGEVTIDGKFISKQPIYETAKQVGSVFQNPRSQFFNVDSTSEVVFGCENMGWPPSSIQKQFTKTTHDYQIENLMERNLFHLSGGEKQKIACAAVSMANPNVFILDEPASNLDCKAIRMLADIIGTWKKEGKTVIIAEHRLNYLRHIADRVIYMENGRIIEDVPAKDFWTIPETEIKRRGLRSINPINFQNIGKNHSMSKDLLELNGFHFSYKNSIELDIPSLSVPIGAIIGIVGDNGAGKTTFARCICGLEKRATGILKMNNQILNQKKRLKNSYLVMQDVNHQLFTESVEEEILIGMPGKEENNRAMAEQIMKNMDLFSLKELHPMSLSGGQKQRVAVASALSSDKNILVFDEPSSGLDYHHMIEVAENLKTLSDLGKTIFLITHDPELIAECCNFFVFIKRGKPVWTGGWTEENRQRLSSFFSAIYTS